MRAASNIGEAPAVTFRKVLLVDDYELFLKQWTREFVREDIRVVTARNMSEALEVAEREQPDVAVVDLFLSPPDTGIEVIRAIKQLDMNIYCVLASAHLTVAYTVLGIRAGADDVFLKPFCAKQVIERIATGSGPEPDPTVPTLDQIEWEHISRVLMDHDGNISTAAAALGVYRQSLQRKIQRYAPHALRTGPVRKRASKSGTTKRSTS